MLPSCRKPKRNEVQSSSAKLKVQSSKFKCKAQVQSSKSKVQSSKLPMIAVSDQKICLMQCSKFSWRPDSGELVDYRVPIAPGMVALRRAALYSGASGAPILRCAGIAKLENVFLLRGSQWPPAPNLQDTSGRLAIGRAITVRPMKTFAVIKDLVTDVAWNYSVNRKIPPFTPRRTSNGKGSARHDRVQSSQGIEFFLCQNVCHVLRDTTSRSNLAGRASLCGWPG